MPSKKKFHVVRSITGLWGIIEEGGGPLDGYFHRGWKKKDAENTIKGLKSGRLVWKYTGMEIVENYPRRGRVLRKLFGEGI